MNKYNIAKGNFWTAYFIVRVVYLIFTVFIYFKLTPVLDTTTYLLAGPDFNLSVMNNSTNFMKFIGGAIGYLFGGNNIFSNLPFMLISFFTVRWAIEKLEFRAHINNYLLFILISLPSFCIWTSICSKEVFGLLFSAILGVLLVNFLKGDYKIRFRDIFASLLCLLFKPQYFLFIFQTLVFIKLSQKYCKRLIAKFTLAFVFLFANLTILYLSSNIIYEYSDIMVTVFTSDDSVSESTRNLDIWEKPHSFFRKAPEGMFMAFFGPYPSEMLKKPLHMIAGLESLFLLILMFTLAGKALKRLFIDWRFDTVIVPAYSILFLGILFVHYPFGIFNPGSAIRYRTNFIFLFIIALLYLMQYYKEQKVNTRIDITHNNK